MKIDTNDILNSIMESLSHIDHIRAEEIPNINLYMDQVTTFMDEQLASTKRFPREIGTTKVIIQNQGKNIRAEVIVNVMNEKEYIKKQKKLQKKLKNPSEKKGGFNSFFKKILGR